MLFSEYWLFYFVIVKKTDILKDDLKEKIA